MHHGLFEEIKKVALMSILWNIKYDWDKCVDSIKKGPNKWCFQENSLCTNYKYYLTTPWMEERVKYISLQRSVKHLIYEVLGKEYTPVVVQRLEKSKEKIHILWRT